MFRTVCSALFLLLYASHMVAQEDAPDQATFAKYRVFRTFRGRPAAMDLSDPDARAFRTRLREAAEHGPNFADHYALAVWGCGAPCVTFAVVNLRTGRATFFSQTISATDSMMDRDIEPLGFRRDSRAIHVRGSLNEAKQAVDRWYLWTGREFKVVSEVPEP